MPKPINCYYSVFTREPLDGTEVADEFLKMVSQHLPSLEPTKFYNKKDRLVSLSDNRALFSEMWRQNGAMWAHEHGGLYGGASVGAYNEHNGVRGFYNADNLVDQSMVAWLCDWCQYCEADLGFYIANEEIGTKVFLNPNEKLAGFRPVKMTYGLPTVPWATYFGGPFIEMFTKERIDSAPFFRIDWFSEESVFCQLTESSMDAINKPEEYVAHQQLIIDVLGSEYFQDPDDPNRETKLPDFPGITFPPKRPKNSYDGPPGCKP